MLLILILSPLLSFLFLVVAGRFLGNKGAVILTTFVLFINVLFTFFFFVSNLLNQTFFFFFLSPWLVVSYLKVSWGFFFDPMVVFMFLIVNCVSLVVHIFSSNYMGSDPYIIRFFSFISFFTFFMLILVSSDNFIQLFVGWEGVGLCSYLLISFWYTRVNALSSGLKALIVNRISDFFFILGCLVIFNYSGSLDFSLVLGICNFFLFNGFSFLNIFFMSVLSLSSFFLLVAAMGKSAQILLHTWLPDAMEGPTPVSALIHAATMVTAGVFLIVRCSIFFEFSHFVLNLLLFFGALTAFISGTVGVAQYDIKKVIAYSTCSQLGYMVLSCGLSNYLSGFFHLINHAFFKALLFLCAGSIIHSCFDEQDSRGLGGLSKLLKVAFFFVFIASSALCGFLFLTGFYSKDFILEHLIFYSVSYKFSFVWAVGTSLIVITTVLTAYYTFRLFSIVFLENIFFFRGLFKFLHESPKPLLYPLFFLFIGSVFLGFFFRDFFLGNGFSFFGSSIYIFPNFHNFFETELLSYFLRLFLFCVVTSLTFGFFPYLLSLFSSVRFRNYFMFYSFSRFFFSWFFLFNSKWFFDLVYNRLVGFFTYNFGFYITYELVDKLLLEKYFGHYSISRVALKISNVFKFFFQRGNLSVYLLFFLVFFYFVWNVCVYLL